MTATSVLLILIGIFIIINAPNVVGVFNGDYEFSFQGAKPTTDTTGMLKGSKAQTANDTKENFSGTSGG